MRLLILANSFDPSVGGYEAVARMLAAEFVTAGMQVKVITFTPSTQSGGYSFDVVRRPSALDFIRLLLWCDVFVHNNVSLRGMWPLLFCRRKWVVIHHGWYTRADGSVGWQDRLKRFCLRFATNISVSKAVADHLPVASEVIHNPYENDVFVLEPEAKRDKELIFLGRLVSDKGADLLIDALSQLKRLGARPKLTIVGHGPEEGKLQRMVSDLFLNEQVTFAGKKAGLELAALLREHDIIVVPSRWEEPFGIVALEGIACGCVVVGSDGGGLKEAIGLCGMTFPNGDAQALASCIIGLIKTPNRLEGYRVNARAHLAGHTRAKVAKAYLELLAKVMSG